MHSYYLICVIILHGVIIKYWSQVYYFSNIFLRNISGLNLILRHHLMKTSSFGQLTNAYIFNYH